MLTAHKAFITKYHGTYNFMTPNPVSYGETALYYYEISSGKAFDGGMLYGVSMLTKEGLNKPADLNRVFYTLTEAEEYIDYLRKERKL